MGSPIGDMVRGAIAGGVATWVMDLVTTGMLQGQDPKVTEREIAAMPNGKPAVANLVDRIEAATGRRLEPSVKDRLASVLHYALGIVPGALYGLLRRFPIVGAKRGLV